LPSTGTDAVCADDAELLSALAAIVASAWQPASAVKIATWLVARLAGIKDAGCGEAGARRDKGR
jgi:hypothetical protein